jgi:hypothetical protein
MELDIRVGQGKAGRDRRRDNKLQKQYSEILEQTVKERTVELERERNNLKKKMNQWKEIFRCKAHSWTIDAI